MHFARSVAVNRCGACPQTLVTRGYACLLVIGVCVGCGTDDMKRDARAYARLEQDFAVHTENAKALREKGDLKAHFAELQKAAPLGEQALTIRARYKDGPEDSEFMKAVEEAKAALK